MICVPAASAGGCSSDQRVPSQCRIVPFDPTAQPWPPPGAKATPSSGDSVSGDRLRVLLPARAVPVQDGAELPDRDGVARVLPRDGEQVQAFRARGNRVHDPAGRRVVVHGGAGEADGERRRAGARVRARRQRDRHERRAVRLRPGHELRAARRRRPVPERVGADQPALVRSREARPSRASREARRGTALQAPCSYTSSCCSAGCDRERRAVRERHRRGREGGSVDRRVAGVGLPGDRAPRAHGVAGCVHQREHLAARAAGRLTRGRRARRHRSCRATCSDHSRAAREGAASGRAARARAEAVGPRPAHLVRVVRRAALVVLEPAAVRARPPDVADVTRSSPPGAGDRAGAGSSAAPSAPPAGRRGVADGCELGLVRGCAGSRHEGLAQAGGVDGVNAPCRTPFASPRSRSARGRRARSRRPRSPSGTGSTAGRCRRTPRGSRRSGSRWKMPCTVGAPAGPPVSCPCWPSTSQASPVGAIAPTSCVVSTVGGREQREGRAVGVAQHVRDAPAAVVRVAQQHGLARPARRTAGERRRRRAAVRRDRSPSPTPRAAGCRRASPAG